VVFLNGQGLVNVPKIVVKEHKNKQENVTTPNHNMVEKIAQNQDHNHVAANSKNVQVRFVVCTFLVIVKKDFPESIIEH